MFDARSHPSCVHHHMAAAHHVAAAYHRLQAVAAFDSCNHEQAQTHAESTDAESNAAQKCSKDFRIERIGDLFDINIRDLVAAREN